MNRPTVRDPRRPPWPAAGAVVVLAGALLAVGDAPARGVTQATVLRGTVTATAGAAGTVASAETRDLVFGTSGTVTQVKVTPGAEVRAGTVLARLDDTEALERVEVAKAAVAAADDTYSKAQQGVCGGGGRASARQADYPALGRSRTTRRSPTTSRTPTPSPTRRTPTPRPTPTPTRTTPGPTPTTARPTHSPTHSARPTTRPSRSGGPRGGSRGGAGGGGGGGGGCKADAVPLAAASVTRAEVEQREAECALVVL